MMNKNFDFKSYQEYKINEPEEKTKSLSYFQDALVRFRRDKSSVVAFFVLMVIVFLVIFGPSMNEYEYDEVHNYAEYLQPRIPFLEDFGIADGTYVIGDPDNPNIGVTVLTYESVYGTSYKEGDSVDEVVLPYEGVYYVFGNQKDINGNRIIEYPPGSITEIYHVNSQTQSGVTWNSAVVRVHTYYRAGEEFENAYFWFGTDSNGRDLWTRLWTGGRVSLILAVTVSITNIIIGTIIGSIAGYYGGATDLIIQRLKEIIRGIPIFIVLILMLMRFGATLPIFILSFALTGWMGTSGVVRAQFYRYKNREYVLAARTLGVSDRKLMFRHILPNAIGPIITSSILMIPSAIFAESSMAYLGFGLAEPQASVGTLLSTGQGLLDTYPYLIFFPALLISLLMVSFNMFGNGLRDAFNPSLRGSE